MFQLYRLLTAILSPLMPFYLALRRRRGKEDAVRGRERLGYAGVPRPKGPLLWFHAASVGESNSILPLLEKIAGRYPQLHILLTTGTVTSAELAKTRLPERALHQYTPVDLPGAVSRFLRHWKPDIALWVESEFWPNLITKTAARGCKMALVNARFSERSYLRWQQARGLFSRMLNCFAVIFPQSEEDGQRFMRMGARHVRYAGNLKFDAPQLSADPKAMGSLLSMIGDRPTWIAASTHPGEEILAAEAHKALRENHPDLLTIIVPRHASRGPEIAAMLRAKGCAVSLRSAGENITDETDIYIADTMGELGMLYRATGIVFMGGSLVPHGGQNPLEAARLDCVVICGPHMDNFAELCRELENEGALLRVRDAAHLTQTVDDLLRNHEKQEALAQAALTVMQEKRGVMEAIIDALKSDLDKLSGPALAFRRTTQVSMGKSPR